MKIGAYWVHLQTCQTCGVTLCCDNSPPGGTALTAQDVCVPGYAKKVRAVPAWLKRQAYAEYGITEYKPGDYEVDHLVPL
jgi:hypothetical protein